MALLKGHEPLAELGQRLASLPKVKLPFLQTPQEVFREEPEVPEVPEFISLPSATGAGGPCSVL